MLNSLKTHIPTERLINQIAWEHDGFHTSPLVIRGFFFKVL